MLEIKRSFKVAPTGRVRVLFTDNMAATIKRIDPEEEEAETFKAACYQRGYPRRDKDEGRPLLVLKMDAPLADIVHEAVHAAHYLLRYAGVKFSMTNDEQVAYLVDYITTKIVKLQARINAKILTT